MLTASQILSFKKPENLFPGNPAEARKHFHELSRQWHPDVSEHDDCSTVYPHILKLYKEAVAKLDKGHWEHDHKYTFRDIYGKSYTISFHKKVEFELGHLYIGSNHITYLIDPVHKDLFNNAVRMTKEFKYASKNMEESIGHSFPKSGSTFKTNDDVLGMQIPKTRDVLSLRDVVEYYKGNIDPRHVAWIMNRLYNLCCYFTYSKFTHNDISLDTVFISPEYHTALLLGGWWYSKEVGTRLRQLPVRTFKLLPWEVQNNKQALPITDLEVVRAIGREMFGDPSGKNLDPKRVPQAMIDWLYSPAAEEARIEYKNWKEVLVECFGPRKFVVMDLDEQKLYLDHK